MAPKHRVAAQVVVLLTLALPAYPYRREYLVTLGGVRKPGSEVCFYHGISGSAYSLYFTPSEVHCLPADSVLDLPPGHFNYFARHRDGYASALRDYTVYDGPPTPERGYQQLEIPLLPAGTVDLSNIVRSLSPSQAVGVWVAPTQSTPGMFLPLVTGETAILAPAQTPLIPLLLESGVPKAIGEPLYLEAGERDSIRSLTPPQTDVSDLVAWVRLDRASADDARSELPGPDVSLEAGGKIFRPVAPLFEPGSYTLLIFKSIPRGPAILKLSGATWQSVRRDLQIDEPTVNDREPLLMVARGSVLVRWAMPETTGPPLACAEPRTKDLPRIAVALQKCETPPGGTERCSAIASKSAIFQSSSELALDGVPGGSYVVAVRPPYGKQQRYPVTVIVGRRETLDVVIAPFTFFGTLKLNGQPLHARLIFATGQAVSDDAGRYTAVLAGPPLTNSIRVERCDDPRWFAHYPAEDIKPNELYDMDLRITAVHVHVSDQQRKPVEGAEVMICVVKKVGDDGQPAQCRQSYSLGTTDASGLLSSEIRSDFPAQLCASHKNFVRTCGAMLDPSKLGNGQTELQFEPVGLHGKVQGHSGTGILAFVAPSGVLSEQVNLTDDGSFVTRHRHTAPEYVVYASATRPLTVLSIPPQNAEDFVIAIPNVPSRSFSVTVPEMADKVGFIGVWVGGRYVPLLSLDFHQTSRGVDSMIYRGKSLLIRDIAATGPISVAYGALDPSLTTFVDIFTLPQFAGVHTHVISDDAISIPVK